MATHVLDGYYLLITFLITVGYQLSGFFIAWVFQFDKITDFTGGSNFFILALVTFLLGAVDLTTETLYTRNIVASVFQMLWAVRIAGFLLFRVLKTGSDTRFDDIRSSFFKFLGFWVGQILWVWTVSLPVVILNSPKVSEYPNPDFGTAADIIGLILWVIGWVTESLADAQKYRYKSGSPPKDRPCDKGLWKWSRHPPYFGEILCWWGIWVLTISPSLYPPSGGFPRIPMSSKSAQYGAVVSPLLTMIILILGSGLPTAEKPTAQRFYLMSNGPDAKPENSNAWQNYKRYLQNTSILVPLPQGVWSKLPGFVKVLLFELPMFRFDEEKDGKSAIEEAKQKKADHQA